MSKLFFDKKVKEFHELKMGSLTMDALINIFLELLHYVTNIKDEKIKIQYFLGSLSTYFKEIIDVDTPRFWRYPYTRKGSLMRKINT